MSEIRFFQLNEHTLNVELYGSDITPGHILDEIHLLTKSIQSQYMPGILDVWNSYNGIGISYNPFLYSFEDIADTIRKYHSELAPFNVTKAMPKVLEVRYDLDSQDIAYVCSRLQLTPEELVFIHSKPIYTVAMIGFLPGFPYLAGLDPKLHIPRKTSPGSVKAGTVAIGGAQCGIYPNDSPGGWYGLGYCKQVFFDNKGHSLFKAGDRIKFKPV